MTSVLIIAVVSALAVLTFFAGIYVVAESPEQVMQRLEAFGAVTQQGATGSKERNSGRLLRSLDRLLSGQSVGQKLALRLAQANLQITGPEFVVIEFSAALVGGALGYTLQRQIISTFAGAVLGILVPWVLLERRRQKRIKAFHDQLTDVLALVVGSLRGGHALLTALDLVSKELGPPASEEFTRVLREVGFGLSQAEALNNLVERMETDDLQLVVTAVNISQEVGGNLSHVLEKIAETIRERIRLEGEIRVLTTQQRLTTYLLVALPFVLCVVLSLINPTWIMGLFKPGWVRLIPAGALVSEIVGFFIAQRLTKIEV